jgi:nitroreductase / dihydropteridine reductase
MLTEKLNWRYATKAMDASKKVSREKLDAILEAINLAPTSSGLQPFEVLVISNDEVRAKIREVAWNQAQVTDSSYLLVFAAWDNYTAERIDAVINQTHEERGTPLEVLNAYYDNLKAMYLPRDAEVNSAHAARQAYIAFGIGLTAAAFEEVDATPMEGFDADKVDEILGLRAKGLRSVTLMPIGYRAQTGDWLQGAKKVRKPMAELVTEIA